MAKKIKGPSILTANDLLTGAIVYWTGSAWSRAVEDAARAGDDEAREALTAAGKAEEGRNAVVGAYLFEVDATTGVPLELRERHRLGGPSIALPTHLKTAA